MWGVAVWGMGYVCGGGGVSVCRGIVQCIHVCVCVCVWRVGVWGMCAEGLKTFVHVCI